MKNIIGASLAIALLGAVGSAKSDTISPAFTAASSGIIQDFAPNDPVNLGMMFTPNANITVNGLGFYDTTGITAGETVAIYNYNSQALITSVFVPNSGTLVGNYFWQSIAPVALTSGTEYVVDAYTGNNPWAWAGDTGPGVNASIVYDGQQYHYGDALQFPDDSAAHASTAYYGPNFSIASGVPDASMTSVLLGLGMIALGCARRFVKE